MAQTLEGGKIGALVTDGAGVNLLVQLESAVDVEGAMPEYVAPKVGGITMRSGSGRAKRWSTAPDRRDQNPFRARLEFAPSYRGHSGESFS